MYGRKWKPSKKAKEEFKEKIQSVEAFLLQHPDIRSSSSMDSYYFEIAGTSYRVSNHSIEASNKRAYDLLTGEQIREKYHDDKRNPETRYIHASKTRIIEIYNALISGRDVDGRGNIKE